MYKKHETKRNEMGYLVFLPYRNLTGFYVFIPYRNLERNFIEKSETPVLEHNTRKTVNPSSIATFYEIIFRILT